MRNAAQGPALLKSSYWSHLMRARCHYCGLPSHGRRLTDTLHRAATYRVTCIPTNLTWAFCKNRKWSPLSSVNPSLPFLLLRRSISTLVPHFPGHALSIQLFCCQACFPDTVALKSVFLGEQGQNKHGSGRLRSSGRWSDRGGGSSSALCLCPASPLPSQFSCLKKRLSSLV